MTSAMLGAVGQRDSGTALGVPTTRQLGSVICVALPGFFITNPRSSLMEYITS